MPGRRWSEGLHQAVEAKEGAKVKPENVTHATITLQNYFRKYEKLAGMTGTASTEAEEFSTIYKLDVLEIPTNLDFENQKPDSDLITLQAKDEEGYPYTFYAQKADQDKNPVFWKRKDYPDVVFRSIEGKLRAIVLEILRLHVIGRPQLVGSSSIENSEILSRRLHADPIRRLAMVTLIREAYFKKNNINVPERTIPELGFLNEPLQNLSLDQMRKFAATLGLASINPETDENLSSLREYMDLEEDHNERLMNALTGGITHQVLNALKHDQESQIIAGAGAFGAVTIATNMAGRGVDIKLGGEIKEEIISDMRKALNEGGVNPYGMSQAEMAASLKEIPVDVKEPYQESISAFLAFLDDMQRVRRVGGLHVIGSERHEARRIDNQLRGRAARQGDPGSSRFYLSLEDDLMRMFGGERAQNMMQLFNIDPSVPLESRMLGRLVEQAQERVEGSNFDIRKHLLEYDDVLNDQRERIYKERDRVLVKESLEEDVLKMLESEISRRVPESLADPEGPWKLLAFLEEMQPTIFYTQQNERILSFTLSRIVDLLKEEAGGSLDAQQLEEAALRIARQALEAESAHLITQTEAFVQRTAESFNTQLAERMELLDIFLDNIDGYAGLPTRELADLLFNQVRLKINLTSELAQDLIGGDEQARDTVRNEVESQLVSIFLSRMVMSIERRLGVRVGLDINALLDKDWIFIENAFCDAINKNYTERIETLESPASQILQNIRTILKRQSESGSMDLVELAAGMPQGLAAAIDPRTRQRVNRRVNLFNYVFLAAGILENKSDEEITAEVLAHLKNVQRELQVVWGHLELQRLSQTDDPKNLLEWSYLENLSQNLGKDQLKALSQKSLQEIIADDEEDFIRAFGHQVQNVIYRHILLRAISDLWIEHLTQMEALRVSIRMEAYAQRDPLVQYKSQSTDRFSDLLASIRMGVISQMFRLQPAQPRQTEPEPRMESKKESPKQGSEDGKKKRKRHKKR
jgi:preprotein translocase subunit SecA